MAKQKKKNGVSKRKNKEQKRESLGEKINLHPDTKKSVWIVVFVGLAIVLLLAGIHQAGPLGEWFYLVMDKLFGIGYYLFPIVSLLLGFSFLSPDQKKVFGFPLAGGILFMFSGLGLIDIIHQGGGGVIGVVMGSLENPFGIVASIFIEFVILVISILVILNKPLHISVINLFQKNEGDNDTEEENELTINLPLELPEHKEPIEEGGDKKKKKKEREDAEEETDVDIKHLNIDVPAGALTARQIKNYVLPPTSLLTSSVEKPTIGDLRGNANVIKRTLESFGIAVEMGEVNVGPTVTRYTLKPAEGVKLSRITTLNQDLSLALAAHPIRIEAPIPGKSLVGIEVPNKAAAVVRLGSLILYPDFQKSDPLVFAIGRNVNGEPIFVNIAKMPHMLIAGATGSGKSIAIHTLIISLLYKNSPDMLKFIFIDPKRVELSIYNGLPHLIAPVVTENKKAIGALRWVIQEMDRRYQLLQEAGSRDIKSYNKSAKEKFPFVLVVIDELADLMSTYGREVEGSIVRLAQMARATGIHLIISTQRPSVEIITGLIKANITGRVALQVASQVDSRTILDTAGAEKLLGGGDLLLQSAELSKPQRIQGGYITEEEIKKVVSFIKKNNDLPDEIISIGEAHEDSGSPLPLFDQMGENNTDDDLFEDAVEIVRSAGKASASLLQRRLRVGYARAARLLDIMEEKGIVGPGDGAKPREILIETGNIEE